MADQLIVTFYTTSEAMATEYACAKKQLQGKIIPVPRTLSSGCGMAWMASPNDEVILKELLDQQGIEWESMTILAF